MPNNPHDEEIIDEVMKFASNPDYGTNDCRNAIRSALSKARKDVEEKARKDERERVGREIVEKFETFKSLSPDTQEERFWDASLKECTEIVSSLTGLNEI